MTMRGRRGLAAAALVAVAALTLLFWPRPPIGVDMTGQAGPHQVRLLIATPAAGVQDVTVEVTGPEPAERLVVAPAMVEMGHAGVPVTATQVAPGRYQASGVEFFMAGRWDVGVTVHGPDRAAEVVFPVLVAP